MHASGNLKRLYTLTIPISVACHANFLLKVQHLMIEREAWADRDDPPFYILVPSTPHEACG
jgi:hypothetical protein